jgi:toxin ParE1/3/4
VVEITWDDYALENVQEIYDYIAKDSIHYAEIQIEKILQRIESLKTHPLAGRVVPELGVNEVRELIEGHYRIMYELFSETSIGILTVHHSARLF